MNNNLTKNDISIEKDSKYIFVLYLQILIKLFVLALYLSNPIFLFMIS